MKKCFAFAVFLVMLSPGLASQDKLSPRFREWLEDISPIITKTEREIFSKLRTDSEREKFIRFFWRQRDPYPDTAENEFYKEYMERVRFADRTFGHGSAKRGSQTDRGYHYVLLGPPLERQYFATQSQIWPLELWYYKGEVEYGLPPYFYLIFYQPEGLGEYRLYSPGVEGPERLIIPTMAPRSLNRSRAHQILKEISAELAGASLSYLPGDQSVRTTGLASTSLLASIRSVPEKKFSDTYARTYLSYKDYVETEYSDNFIDSSFAAGVFVESRQPFLHWTLEPKKMNFVSRGNRFLAIFELVLRLEDMEGNPVLEKTEEIPLSVTPEEYKAHERQAFAFQDILPVIPGRFRLFGLLKNKSAQDFTSFSAMIAVSPSAAGPQSSPLVFYHSREKLSGQQSRGLSAFSFGGTHYLVNARNEFPPQSECGIFVQIPGLKRLSLSPSSTVLVEVRGVDSDAVALSHNISLAEATASDGESLDSGVFSLAPLKPGYYSAEISLVGEKGQKILKASGNFILLSQPIPVSPWVYAKSHPAFPNPEHLFLLSTAFFMTGQYEKAAPLAEQALRLKDDLETRILLGKIFFARGQFQDSLAVLQPTVAAGFSREAAKVMAADYAGLKDWTSALTYLEKLLAEATEVSVLNLAGESYLNLGQPERAVPLLQKSLEIDPNQPGIKALLEKARAGIK